MRSDNILDNLDALAKAKGKQKELLLAQADDDAKRVIVAALDPFTRYHIGKVELPRAGKKQFTDKTSKLLAKLADRTYTGNAAREALAEHLGTLTPKSQELLKRIILKDLRAGLRPKTVNKVFPGLVPSFDCMLAHKYDPKHIKQWPVLVEPKLDGVRVLVAVTDEGVQFFSRAGKEFTSFDHLKPTIEQAGYAGVIIDGEVVSGSFNATVSSVRKKGTEATDAVLHAFDIVNFDTFKSGQRPVVGYEYRRADLHAFVRACDSDNVRQSEATVANSHAEVMDLYADYRSRGFEGAMVKTPQHPYEYKRSKHWLKIKAEESVDVPVVDMFEGTGKYENMLGGFVVNHNGKKVRVGGGFSDAQRDEFWNECSLHDFKGRLIEVEYHEETPDGSLRHPRFKRFRDDKE